MSRPAPLTEKDARAAVLDLVAGEDLTWTDRGAAGTAYQAWLSEDEHRTLTRAERAALLALLDEGRLRLERGWRRERGFVAFAPGRTRS